ncbi:MAG: GlsB/YeaQ/YmgE family stress response membrane protein [Actinomycetota bacterium]|nr:GlsB/YeaQ/YmgE family stress response membrane protein [Actinomycetota bacterium]
MIGFIVAGLIIGALARLLMPGHHHLGILATLFLGLAGSIVGGTAANALGKGDIFELNTVGFVFAVVSAMILVGIVEALSARGRQGRY